MRYSLLLLCFALKAFAFSIAGGYERVFFWNAYLLDCSMNGGRPSLIATTCSTCRTFNGFVDWVNGYDKPFTNVPGGDVELGQMPSDETAKALNDHPANKGEKLTGDVKFGRVVQGEYKAGAVGLQQLMVKVTGFLNDNFDTLRGNPTGASILKSSDKTLTRMIFTRSQGRSKTMVEDLEDNKIEEFRDVTPTTNEKTIRSENGAVNDRYRFLDVGATIRDNPGIDGKAFKQWATNYGDKNHNGNIEEMKRARTKLCNR